MDIGLRVLLWAMRGPISTSRSIRSKASFLLGLHLPPLARAVSTGLSVHKIIGSEINLYFARKVIDEHKDDGKVSYRTNIQSVSEGRSHLLIRKILRIRMTERKLQQDRTTVSSGNLPSLRCFEAESTYLYIDLNTVHHVIEGPKDNKAFLQSQEKTKGRMGGLFLSRLSNRFQKEKTYITVTAISARVMRIRKTNEMPKDDGTAIYSAHLPLRCFEAKYRLSTQSASNNLRVGKVKPKPKDEVTVLR